VAIYLDYAATTPVDPAVAEYMGRFLSLEGDFGNPSSVFHWHGQRAHAAVELARGQVAALLGAAPADVIFLSGATEADNLALRGISTGSRAGRCHIVTMPTEHKAVIEPCRRLEREGHEITYLSPDSRGLLDLQQLRDAIRPDTAVVSIMHVNNETGVVQDIRAISEVVRSTRALLHVDAAQSAGKLPLDLRATSVDMLSLSAHKFYGPKGVGALIARGRARSALRPLIEGGGQEGDLRSGTLPTHQIAAMGEAARLAMSRQQEDLTHVAEACRAFLDELSGMAAFELNGSRTDWYPGIVSVSFEGVDAFAILNALPDVSASASSACSTGTLEPSHVLRAMGIEGDRLYGAVRFSFGRFSGLEEVRVAARRVGQEVRRLRELAATSP
jgi:cysteine desulfurase